MSSITKRLFDADIAFDKLFWIPGECVRPSDGFEDFIGDDAYENAVTETFSKVLPWWKQYRQYVERDDLSASETAEMITEKFAQEGFEGFIAQVSIPQARDFHPDGSGWNCSRNITWTKWFVGATMEDIVKFAEEWAAQRLVEDRKKDLAKQAAKGKKS